MKFGKEFVSQMVPEWQEAYMNYAHLKCILKDLHAFKLRRRSSDAAPALALKRKMTLYRAFSGLTGRYGGLKRSHDLPEDHAILVYDAGDRCETSFLMAAEEGGEYEMVFFRRLDDEFNKVNAFYRKEVGELLEEADGLNKQMDALIALRVKVEVQIPNFHMFGACALSPSEAAAEVSSATHVGVTATGGQLQRMEAIQEVEMSSERWDEASNSGVQEQNEEEVQKVPQTARKLNLNKLKLAPMDVLKHVKINVALETPRSTLKGMLKESKQKNLDFNQMELKRVEKQLKKAFIEFYQKLRVLKSYSFLNMLAFSKIMKKYDKISSRNASKSYLSMVDNSYLGSSDEVTKLMERVEATFIKHFFNSNRRKGMSTLRPVAKREKHRVTFFLGFFAGCAIALLVALISLVHTIQILGTPEGTKFMENIFPLFSVFGLIILHMLMYAANIFFWRRYRVNYSFIFGFKQGTELGYREVFLLSSCLAVMALAGVIYHLDVEVDQKTKSYTTVTEFVPLVLATVILLIAFCPFNIVYRSSRFFLIQCAFHCMLAPLYKVTLPDFFLADQLTSQVQALRGLEFYVCYYGWGYFKKRENKCGQSAVFNTFGYIIACIPYWMRFLQCIRRTVEEHDMMQFYNGLKYFSTIVAVVMRTAYSLNRGKVWLVLAAVSSSIATIVSTYWDLSIDWGLLQRKSKNPLLRDKLLVSRKLVYFVAMFLNVILRFAWMQAVLNFQVAFLHRRAMVATIASLEIIRRGMWNFFRLENEHLNNVGKYRAFKSVPLPFNYEEDDDEDE